MSLPSQTAKHPQNPTFYQLILGLWSHLSPRRHRQLVALLLVMLASGVAEVFSLVAVLPFLSVLASPEQLWRVSVVQGLAAAVGIREARGLLLPATLLFGVAVLLASAVRLMNLWLNCRLSAAIGSDLSCEAYRRTLYQPYVVHVQRNTSEVIAAITVHITQTVLVIHTILQLTTAALVALGILIALVFADWKVALTAITLFGSAYGLLALTARRRLAANSAVMAQATQDQVKNLQEGLGAIRDVLLDGNQNAYVNIYRQSDCRLRITQAQSVFLGDFPRYALEALGMLLIAGLALLLSWQKGGSVGAIPILGTLALGSQRLLPALQQVYGGWALIRTRRADLLNVLHMLDQAIPEAPLNNSSKPLPLKKAVYLHQLSFRYADHEPLVIDEIDLEIRCGERIGIIGTTGSGKSTLLDLMMGLLAPTAGRIFVDEHDLYDPDHLNRLAAWRSSIAHVPQSIYLADTSIAENIAFGVPAELIDMARVRQAAEQAQISAFIDSSAQGYSSFVGERGIRLSGGQRQRIGIARALYKQAQVLFFDEATSALDNETEAAVMEAIQGLSNDLTVIIIAHRLSTVNRCNRVFEVKDGKAVERSVQGLSAIF